MKNTSPEIGKRRKGRERTKCVWVEYHRRVNKKNNKMCGEEERRWKYQYNTKLKLTKTEESRTKWNNKNRQIKVWLVVESVEFGIGVWWSHCFIIHSFIHITASVDRSRVKLNIEHGLSSGVSVVVRNGRSFSGRRSKVLFTSVLQVRRMGRTASQALLRQLLNQTENAVRKVRSLVFVIRPAEVQKVLWEIKKIVSVSS